MKKSTLFFISILIFTVFTIYPQDKQNNDLRILLVPDISILVGQTSYTLQTSNVKSYLEFPLNVITGGIKFIFLTNNMWDYKLGISTNISSPSGVMEDYDWYRDIGSPDILFSYTESKPEISYYEFKGESIRELIKKDNLNLDLTLAYRYQYIQEKIDNFEGWQYQWNETIGTDGAFELYTISESNTSALEYKIQYHRTSFGINSTWEYTPLVFSIGIQPEFIFIKDEDNHILRNKKSKSSGFGAGMTGRLGFRYYLNKSYNKHISYVSFEQKFSYLYAPIESTQVWYGDDPATAEDDTGTVVSNIEHTIRSNQYCLSLSAGFSW